MADPNVSRLKRVHCSVVVIGCAGKVDLCIALTVIYSIHAIISKFVELLSLCDVQKNPSLNVYQVFIAIDNNCT